MHQHRGDAPGAYRFRLPVAMTQDAAAVRRVDQDSFVGKREAKDGTGQKVANYGLRVTARKPTARLERGKPLGKPGRVPIEILNFVNFWNHGILGAMLRATIGAASGIEAEPHLDACKLEDTRCRRPHQCWQGLSLRRFSRSWKLT